jgi:hypothetical protein
MAGILSTPHLAFSQRTCARKDDICHCRRGRLNPDLNNDGAPIGLPHTASCPVRARIMLTRMHAVNQPNVSPMRSKKKSQGTGNLLSTKTFFTGRGAIERCLGPRTQVLLCCGRTEEAVCRNPGQICISSRRSSNAKSLGRLALQRRYFHSPIV